MPHPSSTYSPTTISAHAVLVPYLWLGWRVHHAVSLLSSPQCLLSVISSPWAPVGKYTLNVKTESNIYNPEMGDIYLLFNPWCEGKEGGPATSGLIVTAARDCPWESFSSHFSSSLSHIHCFFSLKQWKQHPHGASGKLGNSNEPAPLWGITLSPLFAPLCHPLLFPFPEPLQMLTEMTGFAKNPD